MTVVRKQGQERWERRDQKKRHRMKQHGRTIGQVYSDAARKRAPRTEDELPTLGDSSDNGGNNG